MIELLIGLVTKLEIELLLALFKAIIIVEKILFHNNLHAKHH
jgi:hypothetical protein